MVKRSGDLTEFAFLSHKHAKCGGFKPFGIRNAIFAILIPTPLAMSVLNAKVQWQGLKMAN